MKSRLYNELGARYWRPRDTAAVLAFVLVLAGTAWVFTYGKAMEREMERRTAELDLKMCLDPDLFANK